MHQVNAVLKKTSLQKVLSLLVTPVRAKKGASNDLGPLMAKGASSEARVENPELLDSLRSHMSVGNEDGLIGSIRSTVMAG